MNELTAQVNSSADNVRTAARQRQLCLRGCGALRRCRTQAIASMHGIEQFHRGLAHHRRPSTRSRSRPTCWRSTRAFLRAARAGEAGKGFAVVAQEVRESVQQPANAAKEIKTLINTSAVQVKEGRSRRPRRRHAAQHLRAGDAHQRSDPKSRHRPASRRSASRKSARRCEPDGSEEQQNAAMVEETTMPA